MALVVVIVRMFEIRSEVIKDCRPILQLLINSKNCTGIAVLVLFSCPDIHFMPHFNIWQVFFYGAVKKNYSIMSEIRDFMKADTAILLESQYFLSFSYCSIRKLTPTFFMFFLSENELLLYFELYAVSVRLAILCSHPSCICS